MIKKSTFFVDIDGTIFIYRKFNEYKNTKAKVIKSTKQFLQRTKDNGDMIILTTARPEEMRNFTINELNKNNIPYDMLIMGIERGIRYILNDIDPEFPNKKRAISLNLIRNKGIDGKL